MPDRTKDIAIVATENNTIYVYDVTPGATIQECYHTNTNGSGENAIPFTDLSGTTPQCNNLVPQEGISGTPAVDIGVTPPALYFVSAVKTSATNWDFKLNVMLLNNGRVAHGTPYYLSGLIKGQTNGTGFSALYQNQRAGLALFRPAVGNKVNLYIGFGSHCDSTPYQGYMAGFQLVYGNPPTFNNLGVFDTENASGGAQGGVWMSGAAPALDANGNVYVAVGNGPFLPVTSGVPVQLWQSVVQLQQSGSSLNVVDYYTPNDYPGLNNGGETVCVINNTGACPTSPVNYSFNLTANDYDLGAAGVTMISPVGSVASLCGTGNGELVAGGKEGVLYGVCFNPSPGSLGAMGGLDSCGYFPSTNCLNNLAGVAATTACTQATSPTQGSIAQCLYGTPNLSNQSLGKDTGNRGTPAFWGGTATSMQNYLYIAGTLDPLRAYQLAPSSGRFVTPQAGVGGDNFGYPGATPSVSWKGPVNNQTADTTTGIVWTTDNGAYGKYNNKTGASTAAGAAILRAYTAIPSGGFLTKVFDSSTSGVGGPGAVKFTAPTIAGGLVFVGGGVVGYSPAPSGTNCTPSAGGGSCAGALYIYGTSAR